MESARIVGRAKALGFDLCGVVHAEQFPEFEHFGDWLERGYGGEMAYLEDPRRREPSRVMRDVRSVIVCALNYNTDYPYSTEAAASQAGESKAPRGWISRYAWGDDYHQVLWDKLNALVATMREEIPEPFAARAYADTGPIAERVFAKYAGLGWLGKNTLLLNETLGSWLFLGVIFTSLELEPSLAATEMPAPDLCGNCRQCLDACPTGALVEPYVLDARRCISYLTIELRGAIPEEFREPMGWQVYGCDICQDVCPYSHAAATTALSAFQPRMLAVSNNSEEEKRIPPFAEAAQGKRAKNALGLTHLGQRDAGPENMRREQCLVAPSVEWLAGMSEEEFRETFRNSAMKRAKWAGLVRNACIALGNSGVRKGTREFERIASLLERLAQSENSTIAESARWALSRIQANG